MWLTYKQVIRLLFPPSPDEALLEKAPAEHFKILHAHNHHGVATLLSYRDPYVRAAIHLAKFHHHADARQLLGAALATHCNNHPVDCIIPVPLSGKRYRERGYNQVVEIISAAQKINPSISFNEKLLVRTKHTRPQTELTRDERLTNVTTAFSLRTQHIPADIRNLNIVLLDDVVTTGSTIKAARAVLAPLHPKSITCVALAG